MAFFKKLGYTFNPQFTDETAACMVISEDIYAMLLTHAKFKEFTPKAICDATKGTEVLVCLSLDSRDQVDDMVRRRSPPAGRTMPSRRTTASCISTAFRIWTGTSGNWSSWNRARCNKARLSQTIAWGAEYENAVRVRPGSFRAGVHFIRGGAFAVASFRGPGGSSVADQQQPPTELGPDKNVKWKVTAPSGVSSPIVAGGNVILTAFEDGKLYTVAYPARTAKRLGAEAPAKQIEPFHKTESSPAASTPATDGERIVSYFGSCGLFCYDLNGKEIWK